MYRESPATGSDAALVSLHIHNRGRLGVTLDLHKVIMAPRPLIHSNAAYRLNITARSWATRRTSLVHCALSRPLFSLPIYNLKMSCQPETQDCNDCPSSSDHCAAVGGSVDIEDYTTELAALKARMRTLESKLSGKTNEETKSLRSWQWLRRTDDPGMSALYLDRYLNFGLTEEELSSHKPIIGIAQSGSDLAPCNRYHLTLAKRVREGIRTAGGIAIEFPTHPIQESSRRPTATLDRNLSYLGTRRAFACLPFRWRCIIDWL